jgi:hypothetical protein
MHGIMQAGMGAVRGEIMHGIMQAWIEAVREEEKDHAGYVSCMMG